MNLGLVIFDCDGVLIDSEALCDGVVSAELTSLGWHLSPEDCHRLFIGLTFSDIKQAAEAHLRRPLGPDWLDHIAQRVTHVMAAEATPSLVPAKPWRQPSRSAFPSGSPPTPRERKWMRNLPAPV